MAALYALLLVVVCLSLQLSGVSGGAFTVKFTEGGYRANEGSTLQISVTLEGLLSGPVHVEVLALTVSEYQEGGFGTQQVSGNPAESSDFSFISSSEYTFLPVQTTRQEHNFLIALEDDSFNEAEEVFILYLNVTDIENDNDRDNTPDVDKVATFHIVDGDEDTEVTIGLVGGTPGSEPSSFRVPESVGEVTVTLNISNPSEDDIPLNIAIVSSSSATEGSDLSLVPTQVVLTSAQTMYTIQCIIINDSIPEDDERATIEVVATGQPVSFPNGDFITIDITDNDDVTYGFMTDQISIREGQSAEVTVGFLTPSVVELSVQLDVEILTGTPDTGTASDGEVDTDPSVTLTPQNMQKSFTVHVDDNNVIQNDRFFTIKLSNSEANDRHTINPASLRVNIVDNDTNIGYGIVSPESPVRVKEGDQITVTVGILYPIPFQPDDDFVVVCDVKIVYENATAADIEGSTDLAMVSLTGSSPSHDITIRTKENDELQGNRVFNVIVQQMSMNSPLVKLESGSVKVVIEEDDGPPNKPEVTINQNKDSFDISWNITITEGRPVTEYDIIITGLKDDGSPGGTTSLKAGPSDTSITAPIAINGTQYPTYEVRVCAKNDHGITCSDKKPITLPIIQNEGDSGNGLSGGATAAIVLVILILLILLVVFLILGLLWMRSRWRDYPPKRIEENDPEFREGRESYGGQP